MNSSNDDATSPTVIILARHGETASNTAGTISTQAPGNELTAAGHDQAAALGRALALRRPSQIYSSHLIRAVETARIVADAVGAMPLTEPDLREIDAGALEGRSDAAAYSTLNNVLTRWTHGDLDARIGEDGEDGHHLVARVRGLLRRWARCHSGGTVVAIAHGGLLEITVPHLAANLPSAHGHGSHLPNCATVELSVTNDGHAICTKWAGKAATADQTEDRQTTEA